MPKIPRVVLDTNVLVSGTIATQGFPSRIFDAAVSKEIVLVISPYILAEYFDVLKRPHIVKKYSILSERARIFTEYLQKRAKQVNPSSIERVIFDDAKDDAILACADAGKAQYVVSGDEHLVQLREYKGIQILTPREFVEQVLLPQ